MGVKVYVASPYGRAATARETHAILESLDMTPSSSWCVAAKASEDLRDAAFHAAQNDRDLASSHAVLALGFPGEGRAMFGEIRLACALGIPVFYVGPDYLDAHRPGVQRFGDLFGALAALTVFAAQRLEAERRCVM